MAPELFTSVQSTSASFKRVRRRALHILASLATLLACWPAISPPPAQAASGSISSQVRQVYEQDNGIPPCRFTSTELTTAQNAVDAYDLEYFADYIGAIQTALTFRAAGACSKMARGSEAVLGRTPPATALPATLTSATRSGVPAPFLLLAVFALVLAGGTAFLTLGRRSESSAVWVARWRHGTAEARYRARGAWDSFIDRLRR